MNSEHEKTIGGASIIPSARPSIHSHRGDCVFSLGERITMGRYGVHGASKTNEESRANDLQNTVIDQGRDEVDNVQSKFRGPSPFTSRRIIQKRNSFDEHTTYTEDSDCRLAKSLPAYLESPLSHSSDEYGNWPSTSPNQSNRSHENSRTDRSCSVNDTSAASHYDSIHNQTREDANSTQPFGLWIAFFSILIAVACAVYNGIIDIPTSIKGFTKSNSYNTAQFYEDLNDLGGKYKITDNTILQLQTGISTIFKKEDTGSFVLAYRSSNSGFDNEVFSNLVNNIAATASKYLRNDSTSVQHIVVDGAKLEMRTHSELISRYRDEVSKTGVMLVREVDRVPAALAMAFHYYCDEYNPLVKRSAIFFTLDMAKCSQNPSEQKPTHAQIEKCLMKKWSGVPKDNISPLLNRVVSTVVNVAGEG